MAKAGPTELTMSDAHRPVRSIAAEFALLFLRELEPKVADDPELLVSTDRGGAGLRRPQACGSGPVATLAGDSRKTREVPADGAPASRAGARRRLRLGVEGRSTDQAGLGHRARAVSRARPARLGLRPYWRPLGGPCASLARLP